MHSRAPHNVAAETEASGYAWRSLLARTVGGESSGMVVSYRVDLDNFAVRSMAERFNHVQEKLDQVCTKSRSLLGIEN